MVFLQEEGKLRLRGVTALPPTQSYLVLGLGARAAPSCLNFPSRNVGSHSLTRGNKCLGHGFTMQLQRGAGKLAGPIPGEERQAGSSLLRRHATGRAQEGEVAALPKRGPRGWFRHPSVHRLADQVLRQRVAAAHGCLEDEEPCTSCSQVRLLLGLN